MGTIKKLLVASLLLCSSLAFGDGISSRLNIRTQDGTVNTYPYSARFTNGTLTDNGDGTVSVTVTGGGGGTPAGETTDVQYNRSSVFQGTAAFQWNEATQGLIIKSTQTFPAFSTLAIDFEQYRTGSTSNCHAFTNDNGNDDAYAICRQGNELDISYMKNAHGASGFTSLSNFWSMTTNGSFPVGSTITLAVPLLSNGIYDTSAVAGQCAQYKTDGSLGASGAACGSGGGGSSVSTGTLSMSWDGGGSVLATGTTYYVPIPSSGTIVGMTITSNASDTLSVYVSSATSASYSTSGPSVASSICASACPSISSGYYAHDEILTGWTTSIAKDGVMGFVLNSATTATAASIIVTYTKS